MNLRYQLMPYLYTLAWNANQKGYPLVRPLFWADANDQDLWQIDDTFLLGENMLVAPVLKEGAIERDIRLPKGNWIEMMDNRVYEGPVSISVPVSLEHIPVLIRSGSLIPMIIDNILELHLFGSPDIPISNNRFLIGQLYSDAGDGYGDWRLDSFHASYNEDGFTAIWESEGEFIFPHQDIRIKFHGLQPKAVHIDGTQYIISNLSISCQKFRTLKIKI